MNFSSKLRFRGNSSAGSLQAWLICTFKILNHSYFDYNWVQKKLIIWPIIVNQERWLVGDTKFHKCNSEMKHLHHAIFLLSD